MPIPHSLKFVTLLLALTVFAFGPQKAVAEEERYSFTVGNKSKAAIVKILVSQDKEKWIKFNIGKGIKSGKTMKLVWAEYTNSQPCKQWIKAVYSGGAESEPAKFDFCEKDLEIEFED